MGYDVKSTANYTDPADGSVALYHKQRRWVGAGGEGAGRPKVQQRQTTSSYLTAGKHTNTDRTFDFTSSARKL